MRDSWQGNGRTGRNGGGSRNGYADREFVAPVAQRGHGAGRGEDEREFFEERTEVKTHALTCPHCGQAADYALTWLVRRKRTRLTGYADADRTARFSKARSYMVRRDDLVACQNIRCRKRFDIAGVQTVAFLEDPASGSVEDRLARVKAAFAGRAR